MSTPRLNRQWVLRERPQGAIQESCFEWREGVPVPEPGDGELLVRNLWLSFDPTQRGWMTRDTYVPKIPLGQVMQAGAVGQVVESRMPGFDPGDLVTGGFGWQDYAVTDGAGVFGLRKLPPGTPPNLALGVLGITGLTAYFGVLDVGRPKAGETFVVSGAAGATGSVAGMIAKIQGCRVVGIAGGPKKCDWLVQDAGFDASIDYKSEDVGSALSRHCPDGVDVYFDNVGGDTLDAVLARIARGARIALCGAISRYEEGDDWGPGPSNYFNLVLQHGTMEGFLVLDYAQRFPEAIGKLLGWLGEGKVRQIEDVQEGLENAPRTLMRLFRGENFGKQLLRIADPE
jgi:NADPH-dependent curcumin reductase CurA